MNEYGNIVGVHTPKSSEIYLNRITQETNLSWVDSSWHNDMCDSIECTDKEAVKKMGFNYIYLPNDSDENLDQLKFNSFSIFDDVNEEHLCTEFIEEIIEFIQSKI